MSKGKLIDRLMHASEENVNSAVRSDLPGQDELGSEVSLNATQEYVAEVACDGRGLELSHHIDIGVEA